MSECFLGSFFPESLFGCTQQRMDAYPVRMGSPSPHGAYRNKKSHLNIRPFHLYLCRSIPFPFGFGILSR